MPPAKKKTKTAKETTDTLVEDVPKDEKPKAKETKTKAPEFTCKRCGGTEFVIREGEVPYCKNPACHATVPGGERYITQGSDEIPACTGHARGECGKKQWVLDETRTKILHCGACGQNWKGEQPDESVIAAIRNRTGQKSAPASGNPVWEN